MKFFKNTELAKLYHVSEKSVRNWISATKEGKLDLELYTENDKSYIANTAENDIILKRLVDRGKKYKNSRGYRVITPNDEFYKTYSNKQVLDIISVGSTQTPASSIRLPGWRRRLLGFVRKSFSSGTGREYPDHLFHPA